MCVSAIIGESCSMWANTKQVKIDWRHFAGKAYVFERKCSVELLRLHFSYQIINETNSCYRNRRWTKKNKNELVNNRTGERETVFPVDWEKLLNKYSIFMIFQLVTANTMRIPNTNNTLLMRFHTNFMDFVLIPQVKRIKSSRKNVRM